MNIPSLPTDNLYKFIAIFGLVLFSIGIYLEQNSFGIDLKQVIEVNTKMNLLSVESDLIIEYTDNLTTDLTDLYDAYLGDKIPEDQYWKLYDEYRERHQILEEKLGNHKLGTEELKKTMDIKNLVASKKESIDSLSQYLKILGASLVVFGFILWYSFHQKYLDAERKWKGMEYIEKLKEKVQQDKAENQPNTDNQEPETESDS